MILANKNGNIEIVKFVTDNSDSVTVVGVGPKSRNKKISHTDLNQKVFKGSSAVKNAINWIKKDSNK